jgi:hypothetical protein
MVALGNLQGIVNTSILSLDMIRKRTHSNVIIVVDSICGDVLSERFACSKMVLLAHINTLEKQLVVV